MSMDIKESAVKMARLIRDAGGSLTGRIRLQKIAFLLELAREEEGFYFDYHHYGPYSEELAQAAETAKAFGFVKEDVRPSSWGGYFSVYSLTSDAPAEPPCSAKRKELIDIANGANAIVLELAATAAYFAAVGCISPTPWDEVKNKKPTKATDERLNDAKALYKKLRDLSPHLPEIL